MRTIIFTQAARQELIDAQDWYERESPGLGRHFRLAIESAVDRISANPDQFPIVHKNIRRALLRRFPYALMFVAESDDGITVIACFHGSRDPARWQRRM
ncbi:MAG: type II toxin-antitoxin system RelE/ParE family toxin [Terracidiphilus sp.]